MIRAWVLFAILIAGLYMGYSFGIEAVEPKLYIATRTITQTETEYITRTITVYKEVPVEVPVVEKEFIQLKHFETLEGLEVWLAQDNTDRLMPAYPDFDCDDFAYRLQRQAMKDGYFISTEIIEQRRKVHMINSALIGDEIYFIEPQDDIVWFYGRRD